MRGLPVNVILDSELWNYVQAVAAAYGLSQSAAAAMIIRNEYQQQVAKLKPKKKGKKS